MRQSWKPCNAFQLALAPPHLVVGGGKGLRYIIEGTRVVEHASDAGPLISDRFSAMAVNPERLQPKEAT